MLKGISPVLSPELLMVLASMGHGDEIVLADAHFPADTCNEYVLRADGVRIPTLLDGIIPLFELDSYVEHPMIMMAVLPNDTLDPQVEQDYMAAVHKHAPNAAAPARIERATFYERAKSAYAVVLTGEQAKYGNLILKKGVTPC